MRAKLGVMIGMLLVVPLLAALDGGESAEAAVRPRLTLSVARAPIAQTASGLANRTTFKGRVTPARKGAVVTLQRKVGARWVSVARAIQNRYGNYEGMYVARSSETLRVSSKPGKVNRLYSSPAKKRRQLALRFGENFSGTQLNAVRWQTRHQDFSGRRMCAKPGSGQAKVGGGHLTLSIKKLDNGNPSECEHGRWLNGMIGSKGRFQNGFFAARVKFQADRGMHGAFWLQGPPVTGAEIDVAEYFGALPKASVLAKQRRLGTLIHYTTASGAVLTNKKIGKQLPAVPRILGKRKTPGNSFHVYGVHWTPKRYQFFLDGKLILTTNRPFVSKAPSEIVLSLLTSDNELRGLTNPRAVVKVDWVRHWK